MAAPDLRRVAAESAALLRTMRANLPASTLVREIQCPRCGRWVTPRRYDPLCRTCRTCKTTLGRPPRQHSRSSALAKVVPAAEWARWDRCPSCDATDIAESRPRLNGVACVVWRCRACGTQTLFASRSGGVR